MIKAAGPVVVGAMAMGSMAVIGQGVSDVVSGQVSSRRPTCVWASGLRWLVQ